jgi:hypothetical protein
VFIGEAPGLFDDRAKDMSRHWSYSRDALKFAHLPKACSNSLHLFERFFPLQQSVIKVPIESPHHSSLFFGRQLREILLPPFLGKDFDPMQAQHAPPAIARFDQRFELPLGIAPIQELIHQCSVDLSSSIHSHPYFFELREAQKQTHPFHIGFIALLRVGVDQPIVARFANDQAFHQRSHNPTSPTSQRSGFHRQVEGAALSFERFNLRPQNICFCRKPNA